ncbi:MAG: AarF/UbiB family protein [Myxococcaceae bacterium]
MDSSIRAKSSSSVTPRTGTHARRSLRLPFVAACAFQGAMLLGSTAVAVAPSADHASLGAKAGTTLELSHQQQDTPARALALTSPAVSNRASDGFENVAHVVPKGTQPVSSGRVTLASKVSLGVAGSYLGLVGLLAMGSGAASNLKRRLETVLAAKSEPPPPSGLRKLLESMVEILGQLGHLIDSMPEPQKFALFQLIHLEEFRSAPLHAQTRMVMKLFGPNADKVAAQAIRALEHFGEFIPGISAAQKKSLLDLVRSESFKSKPLPEQVAEMLATFGPTAADLASRGTNYAQQEWQLFEFLMGSKEPHLRTALQSSAFAAAEPERKVAHLIDTAFGPFATKLLQMIPTTGKGFLGKVAAASRNKLLAMPTEDLQRILARQGSQSSEDVAQGIYNIGGTRFQFELSNEPHVASMGEVHVATRVDAGAKCYFKARKPSASPEAIERDHAFIADSLTLWVPTENQPQVLGYLGHLKADLLRQANFPHEGENADAFEARHGDRVDSPHVFYVSPEGDFLGMTEVPGIPFSEVPPEQALEAQQSLLKEMSAQIASGFFHSDPQPENVRWNPPTRRVGFVDMGSVTELPEIDRVQLLEHALVLMARDPGAIASSLVRSAGRITSTLPTEVLERGLKHALEGPLARTDLQPDRLADEVRRVAEDNGVWSPTDRAVLYRTFSHLDKVLTHPDVRAQVPRETIKSLATGLASLASAEPKATAKAIRNVAMAIARNPGTFSTAAAETIGLAPGTLNDLAQRFENALHMLVPQTPWAPTPEV